MTDGLLIRVVSGSDRGLTTPIDGSVMVGREGNIRLSDSTVSRRHCRFDVSDSGLIVTDLESLDGTRVNGNRITQTSLAPGDLVKIGATTLVVLRLSRYSDAAASDAVLIATDGREVAKPVVDQMTVGRDPLCDISTDDPTVSRDHAVFHTSGNVSEIEDLASSNHTFINGAPVDGRARLADGDVLTFGRAEMSATFRSGPGSDDLTLRVSLEGDDSAVQMTVEAPPGATVAQATAAIAEQLPTASQQTLLYRPRDGALLHPDDLWHATGIWSGEHLVLGEGDASEVAAARGRQWPTRQPRRINQLPRTVDPVQVHHVGALEVPETTSLRGRGMVWQIAGGLGAVLIGLTLAIVNPSYAIFGLITGGIGIISILASIFGDQSRRRHKVTVFLGRIDELDDELDKVHQAQSTRLFDLYPEVDVLGTRIAAGSPRIWERRPSDPDALEVRIGIGTRPAAIDIEEPRGERSELTPLVDELRERHRWLNEVPITVPSTSLGSFGVTGTRQNVRGLLNRMILEAATQLPPDQLRIWVAGTDQSWEWCRWLPQVPTGGLSSSASGANEVLLRAAESLEGGSDGTRSTGGAGGLFGPVTLIVIPDSTIRFDVARLIGRSQDRTLVVVGSDDQRQLPGGVAAFLAIHDQDDRPYGYVTGRYRNAPEGALWVDVIETRRAETLAIELGRITGAREASGSGGLVELLGLGPAAEVDVAESWKRDRPAPLTVAIGTEDSGDPVRIGIRRDGPHGMIAGTTGSGKSELLQSVITALVLQNPPDRLNLFLIDFKGGSTFAQFGSLPHVVGMVTDIENDETLAERAFTSLDAEIERRKRLLDSARVADIKAYEASGDSADRLPNLLVVIDEFALLVQRLPGVKSRLDTVATQGRSLGIHLLLATQSPAGAITHAIRTNTNLWICLRVVTDSESMEILGTRDAARIPDGSPGAGIIRLGAGDSLRSFSAARIARPVRDESSAVRVVRLDGASSHWANSETRTELDLVVEAICRTAETAGIEPARSLWLEPLPHVLTDDQLAEYSDGTADYAGVASEPPGHLRTTVGLTEDLRRQLREPHVVDLTMEGHLLVTGVFGSGRTVALRRIATDLTRRFAPADLHLYGIDGGAGALQQIRDLVNVGEVVRSDDNERLGRLVNRLGREVARRRELLAESSGAPFVDLRHSGDQLPWIVVLVDDYPSLRESAESLDHGRVLERLMGLLQSGPAVGIHLVISTTQATDLKNRELNMFGARIVLQAADSADYGLVGVTGPGATSRATGTPGRGLIRGGHELQVALPGQAPVDETGTGTGTDQNVGRGRDGSWAQPVLRLPTVVPLSQLDAYAVPSGASDQGAERHVTIGLGGPEVQPIRVEYPSYNPVLLISGPARSGRTTALISAAVQLGAAAPSNGSARLTATSPSDAPPEQDDGLRTTVLAARSRAWDAIAPQLGARLHRDPDQFVDALTSVIDGAGSNQLLIVDDADALVGVPGVAERFEKILRTAPQTNTIVVVAARTGDLPGMFDPWSRYLVSLRRVLLLQPTRDDSLYFGLTLPDIPQPICAGRGMLIEGSESTIVQTFDMDAA